MRMTTSRLEYIGVGSRQFTSGLQCCFALNRKDAKNSKLKNPDR